MAAFIECVCRATIGVLSPVKVELLTTRECEPCDKAIEVWRSACQALGLELVLRSDTDPVGSAIVERLRLKAFPAVLIDDRLVAVGVPDRAQAERLLRDASSSPPAT